MSDFRNKRGVADGVVLYSTIYTMRFLYQRIR